MNNLQAVAIDNQIKLLSSSSKIEISLIIPRGNIQRAKELTGFKILSKTPHKATFNHNAGELYMVRVSVQWGKISAYFNKTVNAKQCQNWEMLFALTDTNPNESGYYHNQILDGSKIPLYAFGSPKMRNYTGVTNGIYQNKAGNKISLIGKFENHVNFKGDWFRLIATN